MRAAYELVYRSHEHGLGYAPARRCHFAPQATPRHYRHRHDFLATTATHAALLVAALAVLRLQRGAAGFIPTAMPRAVVGLDAVVSLSAVLGCIVMI